MKNHNKNFPNPPDFFPPPVVGVVFVPVFVVDSFGLEEAHFYVHSAY